MNILIFAAHSDDVELAMGATLAKLLREDNTIKLVILSKAENIEGNKGITQELINSLDEFDKVSPFSYTYGKFDTDSLTTRFQDVKDFIYKYRDELDWDMVFCPSQEAMHDDHRAVARAVKAIFLGFTIYSYIDIRGGQETMANAWFQVTQEDIIVKLKALSCYKSQINLHNRYYFDFDSLEGLSKFRGLQCGRHLAEGFQLVRQIIL